MGTTIEQFRYSVPEMTCGHCESAVKQELTGLSCVSAVQVDLATKVVSVDGEGLDDAAIVAAIDEAGFDAQRLGES